MGIIAISAGCGARSRVHGKSGDLSCHSAGGRGWAWAGCRRRRTRELLGSISAGDSSGEGKAQAGSEVPRQGCSPRVPDTPPPLSLFPWTCAELVLRLPAASPVAAACQEPPVQAEIPPPSRFIPWCHQSQSFLTSPVTSRVLPHIPGAAAGLGRGGHGSSGRPHSAAPSRSRSGSPWHSGEGGRAGARPCRLHSPPKRSPSAPGLSKPPLLLAPMRWRIPWGGGSHRMEDPTGWRIPWEAPRARLGRAGRQRCQHQSDASHQLCRCPRVGDRCARYRGCRGTSGPGFGFHRGVHHIPPAGWRRGRAHLEAIAAVTLQGDTAPRRGEPDTSPQQPPPALLLRQMSRAPAPPAATPILPGAEPLPATAMRSSGPEMGRGKGLSPGWGSSGWGDPQLGAGASGTRDGAAPAGPSAPPGTATRPPGVWLWTLPAQRSPAPRWAPPRAPLGAGQGDAFPSS